MPYYGTKRRVFISHFKGDSVEVNAFIDTFANREGVFTPYVLGANNNDDFINSTNTDYVMKRIRELYLKDSTVTIVLLGSCTHSRRYVDWEIKSSLTQGDDQPNGLIGLLLPSRTSAHLPDRLAKNWNKEHVKCYARYWAYPSSAEQLGLWIDDAYEARTQRALWIQNPQEMMGNNQKCKIHSVTH